MPFPRSFRHLALAALTFLLLATASVIPLQHASAQETLNEVQRTEIEKLIHQYIVENPEVIMEAIEVLQQRQVAMEEEESQAAVRDFKVRLANGLNAPTLGPASAPVTIVEFFDYRCGYCKRMLPDMQALMKNGEDIRFVFMEFPILGDDSVKASEAALAVWLNWPTKYIAMHNVLMGSRGGLDENKIMELASGIGIDTDALREAMESNQVDAMIRDSYELAQSMNINGTPAFIIGDELVRGAIDMADMQQLIDAARGS